ncbi:MAG TPA: ABC transporter permease subunit [Candidatus Bathyarchaeia archaeon]|nr:ABC transporter permease subunit [Candidatus Bathyarchaeia archaeon]
MLSVAIPPEHVRLQVAAGEVEEQQSVIPLGFYVSQKDYEARRQAYDQTVRDYDQSRKTVVDFIRNGGAAFRPPSPLGLLSHGLESVLPSSVETRGYISDQGAEVQFNNARRIENPFTALFGRLDLAFMVSTVLAVLVMIFTFNAVAGEKERRTLAQVMANPVPRATILTAKMAAASSLLAAAFLAGTAAGGLLTTALGLGPFGEAGTSGPFLIAIGVSLVFLVVLVNLGLLVSAVTRSPVSAMVTLVAVWVALAMILPKGSVVLSRLLLPVESQQIVDLRENQVRTQNARDLSAELTRLQESTPVIKDMSMTEYFKQSREKNPAVAAFEDAQAKVKAGFTARLNADLDRLDAEFERRRGRQAALARTIARLSPVSCFVHIVTELAGTGFTEEAAWRETRARFKQLLDREIAPKMLMHTFGQATYGSMDLDREAPAPKLPPDVVPLERRLDAVGLDLALLAAYGILFFAGAAVVFLRYDVR